MFTYIYIYICNAAVRYGRLPRQDTGFFVGGAPRLQAQSHADGEVPMSEGNPRGEFSG